MKQFSEAELIEIENRAAALEDLLDCDPEALKVETLLYRWETAHDDTGALLKDIHDLCEVARARKEPAACEPSK